MPPVVSLREVVDAIDGQIEESSSYLNPATGEIVGVTAEERRLVEDNEPVDDLPAWQCEMLPKVREVLESDRFLALPDRFDVHDWSIMEKFSYAQNDERICKTLLGTIHGSGAFRNFRSAIQALDLEQGWYRFRNEALKEIARNWLEQHKIPYK